jgi:hypothetical protein
MYLHASGTKARRFAAFVPIAMLRAGPPRAKRAVDQAEIGRRPCRAIEIVAHGGQLYAAIQETPYCDRTRYSKSARAVPGWGKSCRELALIEIESTSETGL